MGMRIVSLSKEELLKLLKVAKSHSESDWLLIATTFWHGLRASEIVGEKGITGNSIKDGYLTVERLKGSEKTTQPLISHNEPLLSYKDALIERAKEAQDKPLFSISRYDFYHLMRKYGRIVGIPAHKCKPHALKHTCAMLMLGPEKTNVERVRAHLGHKNLNSTGYYLNITPEEAAKTMADAMGGSL